MVACVDGELRIYAKRTRVAAFLNMPAPNANKKQLLGALSSASWWRNSIRGFGHIAKPLYALCGDASNVKKNWNSVHDKAWRDLKTAIATATCRFAANPNYQKVIVTDACQQTPEYPGGLAGVVFQVHPATGQLQPLGFMARPLQQGREMSMPPRHLERREM